jgi:hypothetical protein
MKIRIYHFILIFAAQLLIGYVSYCLLYSLGSQFVKTYTSNISFGITLRLASYMYVILSFISSLFFILIKNIKMRIFLCMITYFIFILYLTNDFCQTPYKYLLLYSSSFIGIFIPFISYVIIVNILRSKKI